VSHQSTHFLSFFRIYLLINKLIVVWCREDGGQVEFAALEQLENPHYHVGSARTVNNYIKIKEVIALLQCPAVFTLKDLLKPQADRTQFFLSAILNFCLHKDSKMNELRPIGEELSLLDEQRREFDDKISQVGLLL
jgi:kinetochore protein Nuf2